MQSLYPLLLAYAATYIALPAVRFARLGQQNAQVEERNKVRRTWRDAVRAGSEQLSAKLKAAAQKQSALRIVGSQDLEFDSGKDLDQQPNAFVAPDLDDFDRRLREADGRK